MKEGRESEVLPLLTASCVGPEASWQGCMALGEYFLAGEGVERSTLRAVELFERVCEMKVRAGCVRGARVAGDRDRTYSLLGKACALGELDACMQAAQLGGNPGEGRRWLVEACERFRHAPACERIKE
jgi:TPR repeat protein